MKMVIDYSPKSVYNNMTIGRTLSLFVSKTGRSFHAVYAKSYIMKSGIFCCVNSWGEKDPNPRVSKDDARYLYYVSIRQVTN